MNNPEHEVACKEAKKTLTDHIKACIAHEKTIIEYAEQCLKDGEDILFVSDKQTVRSAKTRLAAAEEALKVFDTFRLIHNSRSCV